MSVEAVQAKAGAKKTVANLQRALDTTVAALGDEVPEAKQLKER